MYHVHHFLEKGLTDSGLVRQKSIPNAKASGMIRQNDTIGILLAGGLAQGFHNSVSKHVLPIYDKPTIFYSLSMLMLAVKTIVIVCTQNDEALQTVAR